jgi:drug/metabolite transporter (DMT)-like permease
MEAWIVITIAAAFLQNLRSALQKHLRSSLSTTGASFVRFGYGFPLAIVYVLVLNFAFGYAFPDLNWTFALWSLFGGLMQIFATMLLVHLFSLRNFAVGTAYSKTEPVQAALFGFILLGEKLTPGSIVAIFIGVIGVMMISMARLPLSWRNLGIAMTGKTALIGMASGATFGLTSISYRSASLSLSDPNPVMSAAVTLACVTTCQTVCMLLWMLMRDRAEIGRVARSWRSSSLVGLAGVVGSACWFTAMTLQPVAYVKALGQIELIFTFMASYFLFKEHVTRMEVAGCLLIVSGILTLLIS